MESYNKKDILLLRSIIMEHYERPKHKVSFIEDELNYISHHDKTESCIDDITVYLKIKDDIIVDAKFLGTGCAVATSSTDIMCEYAINKTKEHLLLIIEEYSKMVNGQEYNEDVMEQLIAFYNISNQRNRIRCASIGINAIKSCLLK